jgi:hypothetical protein
MEDVREDRRCRDRRCHIRQVVNGPVEIASGDLLEKHVRDDESQADLDRHRHRRIRECRGEGLPERLRACRVLPEDVEVVVEAAECALDDVPAEERDVHRVERRQDLEQAEERDRRHEEEVGLRVFEEATTAAGRRALVDGDGPSRHLRR